VRFDLEDSSVGEKLDIVYPGGQSNAEVSILASESLAPANTSAEGLFTFEGIKIGAFNLDSDIEDIYKDNLLVIGGPCSNAVAKELLGNYDPCTAGFEEGKAILRIFNLPESFAILAAGYSAEDTQKAVHVLENVKDYPFLTDTFVEISGSLDNLKFRQLTPKEWQDRVDYAKIQDKKVEVSEEVQNKTEQPITNISEETFEEQATMKEFGFGEEDLSLKTNQNIMLIIGIFIFVAVILLISYMSYKNHQQEEAEEEDKHAKRGVPAVNFKNVPKQNKDDDEEDELEEGRKAAAVPKKKDKRTVKEEKKKRKELEKQRKKQEKIRAKEEKKMVKAEKKEKKSTGKKEDVEEVDLDSLGDELIKGVEEHKKK